MNAIVDKVENIMLSWLIRWFRSLFGSKPQQKMLPAPRVPQLVSLQVGDVVVHLDRTYLVSQRIVHHANGFFWYDYQLYDDSEDEHLWLSVEDDDELIVAFYRPVDFVLEREPGKQLMVAGKTYRLKESGESDAKISRASGTETRTRSRRWDYVGPDKSTLSVQCWGDDEFEVMQGERVRPSVLELMPGS